MRSNVFQALLLQRRYYLTTLLPPTIYPNNFYDWHPLNFVTLPRRRQLDIDQLKSLQLWRGEPCSLVHLGLTLAYKDLAKCRLVVNCKKTAELWPVLILLLPRWECFSNLHRKFWMKGMWKFGLWPWHRLISQKMPFECHFETHLLI